MPSYLRPINMKLALRLDIYQSRAHNHICPIGIHCLRAERSRTANRRGTRKGSKAKKRKRWNGAFWKKAEARPQNVSPIVPNENAGSGGYNFCNFNSLFVALGPSKRDPKSRPLNSESNRSNPNGEGLDSKCVAKGHSGRNRPNVEKRLVR